MADLSRLIAQLRQERSRAADELRHLDQAIMVLTTVNGTRSRNTAVGTSTRPHRKLSAAGRRRIAAAQRARWARVKSANATKATPSLKVQPAATKKAPVRVLSRSARNKIAAAQRARWAKVRAQKHNKQKAA